MDNLEKTTSVSNSALEVCEYFPSESSTDKEYQNTSSDAGTQINTRAITTLDENREVYMEGYGATSTRIAAAKVRAAYSSTNPIVMGAGLPGGTYFVEVIAVTKDLESYRAGDVIAPITPDSDADDVGLSSSGYFVTTKGWNSNETIENGDKDFVGTTYLIHFLYNLSGATLDKYYPCRPEELVWRYNSIQLY